jgi:hypothetical protein
MTEKVETDTQIWQLPDGRFGIVRVLEERNGIVTLLTSVVSVYHDRDDAERALEQAMLALSK